MKKLIVPFAATMVLFASCTKEVTPNPNREAMLRSGKWKISTSMVTLRMPNGLKGTVDYGANRSACLVDNYLKFDSTNKGAVHNGGVSCSGFDADSIGFTWQLKNNGNNIDMLGCYTVIDSVKPSIYFDGTDNIYKVAYGTGPSYRSSIVNGVLTGFSQSSFVLEYSIPGYYADTMPANGGSAASPVYLPDTFNYHITYSNF
jgi:hypothetical protein